MDLSYVVINETSEGRAPPFFRKITADPCFNLPELLFLNAAVSSYKILFIMAQEAHKSVNLACSSR